MGKRIFNIVLTIAIILAMVPVLAEKTKAAESKPDYLCFTAQETAKIFMKSTCEMGKPASYLDYLDDIKFKYSVDGGITWTNYEIKKECGGPEGKDVVSAEGDYINLNKDDKVYFKADGENGPLTEDFSHGSLKFEISGKVAASGNVMSLLDETCQLTEAPGFAFCKLFQGCSLTTAPKLPATKIGGCAYYEMFKECEELKKAPELPAETLDSEPSLVNGPENYAYMFEGCFKLIEAPKILPAKNLTSGCYRYMFNHCDSLKKAPELPATTMKESCYREMFAHCTSLEEAPKLPAMELDESCYFGMFWDCYNIKKTPELPQCH